MQYSDIHKAVFLERPNRFIAHCTVDGMLETVHVKNTGRCRELLVPGATVYLEKSSNPNRKTAYDLVTVETPFGLVNMDAAAPNQVAGELLRAGAILSSPTLVQPEVRFGASRLDFYAENDRQRLFVEVKGVTLDMDGTAMFPDAPTERGIRHLEGLAQAVKDGYGAAALFVIQMKDVRYFTPNRQTHPEFAEALAEAERNGVKILAYDCSVTEDSIELGKEVPVVLEYPQLYEMREPLVQWYRENKRDLPWRENPEAYRVWISEIMLQQTRVEAVKGYYDRFLKTLPDVQSLAEAEEDQLLKLWEGLGYYNRVRNMQKAARQIMVDYHGVFPSDYEEIRSLTGIGSYTAGAISSFAFGKPEPAVDGNVLRVLTRILADHSDIMKQSTKTKMEKALRKVIPEGSPSDFNQGLIELGAIVCVPNGEPKCQECPVSHLCRAREEGRISEFPVKKKAKARRIEDKTILVFRDDEEIAIGKRDKKGLLAGLYELPNVPGHLSRKEVENYCKEIGLLPIRIKKLPAAKHIFSHVEWHMIGYDIRVDELEKTNKKEFLFIHPGEIEKTYPIPAAFEMYMPKE